MPNIFTPNPSRPWEHDWTADPEAAGQRYMAGDPTDPMGSGAESDAVPDPMSAAAILKRGLFMHTLNDDMRMTMTPGPGAQGPVDQQDPVSALQAFLRGQPQDTGYVGQDVAHTASDALAGGGGDISADPTAHTFSSGNRNNVLTAALAHRYGIADDGSSPQTDFQAADDQLRAAAVHDKIATELPPIDAKGQWDMRTGAQKGQFDLQGDVVKNQGTANVANINAQSNQEREASRAASALAVAQAKVPEIGPGGMPVNNKPLSAVEQRSVESMMQGAPMVDELLTTLDPTKNQLTDWLQKQAQYKAYQNGITTGDPVDQRRIALAGLLKVIGASPYVAGSRHFQFMQQAQEHLTDPGATDKFLYDQLMTLKKIWPEMQDGLIRAHRFPGSPIWSDPTAGAAGGDAAGDPYADPNYQPK